MQLGLFLLLIIDRHHKRCIMNNEMFNILTICNSRINLFLLSIMTTSGQKEDGSKKFVLKTPKVKFLSKFIKYMKLKAKIDDTVKIKMQ